MNSIRTVPVHMKVGEFKVCVVCSVCFLPKQIIRLVLKSIAIAGRLFSFIVESGDHCCMAAAVPGGRAYQVFIMDTHTHTHTQNSAVLIPVGMRLCVSS